MKKNREQTLLIIAGVVIATILICGVGGLFFGLFGATRFVMAPATITVMPLATNIPLSPTPTAITAPARKTAVSPNASPPLVDLPPASPIATSALVPGWLTYENDFYGYRFSYPPEAAIRTQGVTGFRTEERPTSMTEEAYLTQLEAIYPDDICVRVNVGAGFVTIQPAEEAGGKYTVPCGITGVGAYEIENITETVTIDGQSYTASGFLGRNTDTDAWASESYILWLEDGTRIDYGSMKGTQAEFQEVEETLRQIVTSLQFTKTPAFYLPGNLEEVGWLTHNRGKVEALAFSPDGYILATGHNNGDVILWKMATGEQLQLLPHPQSQSGILDLAFNADSSLLAVAEAFVGQITLWDVSSGGKLRTLDAEGAIGEALTDVAFSPDSSLLAAAKSSGQSQEPAGRTFVWDTEDWQQMHVLEDAAPPIAFDPEGGQLNTLSGVSAVMWTPEREPAPIVRWNLKSGKRTDEIPVDGFVISLTLSPNGKMLVANVIQMGVNPFTLVLNMTNSEILHILPMPEGVLAPDALAYSPDGARLIVSYQPNKVIVWDTQTGEVSREFQGSADWLEHPVLSPDGSLLAAASSDERILFWEMP